MNMIQDTGQFTTFIPLEAHQTARTFRSRLSDPAQGKQIYLNTLAVYAVRDYLSIFGIETELENSSSWDPIAQTLLDTGSLKIAHLGQVECRPVLPNTSDCHIPVDVWSDRLGYIPVQFDAQLEQCTLIGFLSRVSKETIPLTEFSQLETLFDVLEEGTIPSAITVLSQWFDIVAQSGWQIVESLLETPQPAFSFRTESQKLTFESQIPDEETRGKLLDFGIPEFDNSLALLIGISPAQTATFNIRLKVIPLGDATHLPKDLDVSILDESGQGIMQAQTRESQTLELRFGGEVGDCFQVRLTLNDQSINEQFVIQSLSWIVNP